MKRRAVSLALALFMLLALIPFGAAADAYPWEGSGDIDDPYLISDIDDLYLLLKFYYKFDSKYFKLTSDIEINDESFDLKADTGLVCVTDGTNTAYLGTGVLGDESGENAQFDISPSEAGQWYVLSENTYVSGEYSGYVNGWTPIGNTNRAFSCNIDGDGYTVSGLFANPLSPAQDNVGFFGVVKNAEIKNFRIESSYINAQSAVGAVAAAVDADSKIDNCYSKAIVIGNMLVGGIAGTAECEIMRCINESYVFGNYGVGGIAGASSDISYSYNSGIVDGNNNVGGICGGTAGFVEKSYNTGAVFGNENVGGVCGYNMGKVCNTYNAGMVSGNENTGAVVGGTVADDCADGISYYLSGTAASGGGNAAMALSEEAMKNADSFPDWDFRLDWALVPESGYDYPQIIDLVDPAYAVRSALWDGMVSEKFSSGDGTETDPYIIVSESQLAYLAKRVNDGEAFKGCYFRLDSDLCFNDTSSPLWRVNAIPWTPIGNESNPFCGNFDGNNRKITGVYIKIAGDAGLFGCVDNAAVKNLSLEDSYIENTGSYTGALAGSAMGESVVENIIVNADIAGRDFVGGIVGYSRGRIESCGFYGSIKADSCAGGISGESSGDIIFCSNYGNIDASVYVGGISGKNLGSEISKCQNRGTVAGELLVGGVSGLAELSDINNCYNTSTVYGEMYSGGILGAGNAHVSVSYNSGVVTGDNYVGAIVGMDMGGEFKDNYYHGNGSTEDEAIPIGKGFDKSNEYGVPDVLGEIYWLGKEEMKNKESFVGFDFENIWTMNGRTDYDYPELVHAHNSYTANPDGETHHIDCVCGRFDELHVFESVYNGVSCDTDGTVQHTCKICGYSHTEDVNAYGHTEGEWVTVTEATYESEGLEEKRCTKCGDLIDSRVTPMLEKDEPVIPPVDEDVDFILGDVNKNGKIDMTDYILLKRAYFGTFTFDEYQNKAGDINKNDKIDMTDYILLKRVYFGTYTIK